MKTEQAPAEGGPAATTSSFRSRRRASAIASAFASVVACGTAALALAAPGELDPAFGGGDGSITTNAGEGPNQVGTFQDVVRQTDGKLVAVGSIDTSGADNVFAVARFAADGTPDASFGDAGEAVVEVPGADPGAELRPSGVALQADGKIVVAGSGAFGGGESDTDYFVMRLDATGTVDTSFDGDGVATASAEPGQPDRDASVAAAGGRIAVAGDSADELGLVVFEQADGSLDETFAGDGTVFNELAGGDRLIPADVEFESDGRILVGGSVSFNDSMLLRFETTGSSADLQTADFGAAERITDIALDSMGRIVAAGEVNGDMLVARFDTNLDPDPAFGGGLGFVPLDGPDQGGDDDSEDGRGVAIQPDGKIVVGGFKFTPTELDLVAARVNTDGSPDNGYGTDGFSVIDAAPNGDERAEAMAFDPVSGRAILAGEVRVGDSNAAALFGISDVGALDPGFGGDGVVTRRFRGPSEDAGTAVAELPNGRVLVAGSSNRDGDQDILLARYTASGALDPSFGTGGLRLVQSAPGLDEQIDAMAVRPDGKIVLAGSVVSDDSDFLVARLGPDGTPDPTFGGDGFATRDIGEGDGAQGVALGPNGSVFGAGGTCGPGGCDTAVVAFDDEGDPLATFAGGEAVIDVSPGELDSGRDLVVQDDGKVVVAGQANAASTDTALVRLTTSGGLDTLDFGGGTGIVMEDLGQGDGDGANAIALEPGTGRLLTAGFVDAAGGREFAVAAFDDGGDLDLGFGGGDGLTTTAFGAGSDSVAEDLALGGDRIVVAGRSFSPDAPVARYTSNGSLDPEFSGDGRMSFTFEGLRSEADAVTIGSGSDPLVTGAGFSDTTAADLGLARIQGSVRPPADQGRPEAPVVSCRGRAATIVGTPGGDRLRGTPGPDVIAALGGGDVVIASGGNDLVCGGDGDDDLRGGAGDDELRGERGDDKLRGGAGRDKLIGGGGQDVLRGGKGRDRLKGGGGRDNERQ